MITRHKSKWLASSLFTFIALGAWLCYLRLARADAPYTPDTVVTVDALAAHPDVLSVNTPSEITVNANAFPDPEGVLEHLLDCPEWTFTLVNARYTATVPPGGFTSAFWAGVPDAAKGTDFTEDLDSGPDANPDASSSTDTSASKHFHFTPLRPGYWHITVNVDVVFADPDGNHGPIVPSGQISTSGVDSPPDGRTLTAVQLDIIWVGETINDTSNPPVAVPTSTIITNKSCYMAIGKRVSVNSSVLPTDLDCSNHPHWLVPHTVPASQPGCAILGYITNPTQPLIFPSSDQGWWNSATTMPNGAGSPPSGTADALIDHVADKLQQLPGLELDFYWSMISAASENDVVQYVVNLPDPNSTSPVRITAKTTFVLESPNVVLFGPIPQPAPTLDNSYSPCPGVAAFHFGVPEEPVGMEIIQLVQDTSHATGAGSMSLAWVQVDDNKSAGYQVKDPTGTGEYWIKLSPTSACEIDTRLPAIVSTPGLPATFEDSPGINCTDIEPDGYVSIHVFDHDSFYAYLMYRPQGTNTIFVPIRMQQWDWGGDCIFTGSGSRLDPANWAEALDSSGNPSWYSHPAPGPGPLVGGAFPNWYSFKGNVALDAFGR